MFAAQSLDPDASLTDINVLKPEDNPTDTVSCISWSPNADFPWFACSDWDSKIRVYDISPSNENGNTKGINQKVFFNTEEPCISVAWQEDLTKLFAGCIDNTVKSLDMMTGKPTVLGHHDGAVKDVYWVPSLNVVCSLSFDKTIKFWDARQSTPTMATHLNFKPYCSDFLFPNLAIGMSEEKIAIIDLLVAQQQQASLRTHEGLLESPLGHGVQISAISFFNGGSGIGTATYEGRANLSTIENSLFGSRLGNIMTFKCHKSDNPPVLYPVHSIGFNPRNKFFLYTAGGEGSLIFWDYEAKSKIKTFSFKGVPVTKAKSSPDGMYIAYALGYDWARGVEGSKSIKSKVCVHSITQDELVYKPR